METSLHRQLKQLYADGEAQQEVPLGRFRIDVVTERRLVEIQHGSLAAIRDKIATLVKAHRVLVVKPIVASKKIIKCSDRDGDVISQRRSPKRGSVLDLFDELVYFTRVFPHDNLQLEAALVDVEEWRYPGHGRRRRRRANDYLIQDQKLVRLNRVVRLQTAADLAKLIKGKLPSPFHTGHLARAARVERWVAQRIAYCFRKMGTTITVGKQGNAWLYELAH